ncbi:TlpA family protein disulfide reductase [Porticoccus sp.]|uniref:TlpA family protein disulfide reductase n=1 Tax=Porticoccus sp. TaxID=2024853 RepID=UPI003F69EBA2
MKHSAIRLLTTLLVLTAIGCSDREQGYALLDGGRIDFDQLHGKVVLINYWAEWCKPCREEIPELNAFQRSHSDRVQLLAVNYDGVTGETLQQQATALGIDFPVLLDDPRQQFNVKPSGVLPETLIIDAAGNYRQVLLGPQTEEKLAALLAELSNESITEK